MSDVNKQLLEALKDLFASYKQLADSGDAGNWRIEDFPEGKQAIEAIAAAEQAQQADPVAWKHDCAALLMNDVELWVRNCPHCGKPRAAQQSLQVNHIVETTKMGRQVEHNLKDVRCECCGYMTYHREHMGCIRAASHQAQWQPIESNLPSCKESAIEYLVFDTLNNKVGHDYWMVPDDGGEPFWNHYGEYVSHWMPLPQGPNVVD